MPAAAPSVETRSGTLLHVGCGNERVTDDGLLSGYDEVRLDIDPNMKPDIVASMTDMGDIGPFDMVYSSHSLEHLDPEGVRKALSEFYRVLKPGGSVLIFVPDLEDVPMTEEPLYESPAGPICGLDLMYGLRWALEAQPYMAHRTAFVRDTLEGVLIEAGFSPVHVKRIDCYNLIATARKP